MYNFIYIFLLLSSILVLFIDLASIKNNYVSNSIKFIISALNLLAIIFLSFIGKNTSPSFFVLFNIIFSIIYDKKTSFNVILLNLITLIFLIPILSFYGPYVIDNGVKIYAPNTYFVLLAVISIIYYALNVYTTIKIAKVSKINFIIFIIFQTIIYLEFLFIYFYLH